MQTGVIISPLVFTNTSLYVSILPKQNTMILSSEVFPINFRVFQQKQDAIAETERKWTCKFIYF